MLLFPQVPALVEATCRAAVAVEETIMEAPTNSIRCLTHHKPHFGVYQTDVECPPTTILVVARCNTKALLAWVPEAQP